MKKLISHIFLYLTLASATLAFPAPTLPPVDFFAARAFGGNNAVYYETQPGDFDGDGRPDVITSSATALYVFFGDGSGDYSAEPLTLYAYSSSEYVYPEIGDFNNDGRDDAAFPRTNPQTLEPSIAVYFGNADRTFSQPAFSAVTPRARSLHRVDWDLDGKLDLLGKADGTGASLLVFYKGSGTGSFTASTQLSLAREPLSVRTGDFNADGRPDAAITDSEGLKVSQNMPNASFGPAAAIDTIDFGFKSSAVADLNNDGRSDIVATEGITSSPIAAVWLATGNMGFAHAGDISLGSNTDGKGRLLQRRNRVWPWLF